MSGLRENLLGQQEDGSPSQGKLLIVSGPLSNRSNCHNSNAQISYKFFFQVIFTVIIEFGAGTYEL